MALWFKDLEMRRGDLGLVLGLGVVSVFSHTVMFAVMLSRRVS